MARVLKRCPKCSRKITNKIECKHCGLLFERYFKAENQKRAEELARVAKKDRMRRIINAGVSLLLIAVIGGGAFYYFNVRTPASEPTNTVSRDNLQPNNSAADNQTGAPQDSENVGRAKQATVAISTPWGNGTGFFVDSNLLLTNKHIVEQKKDGLADARASFETYRNWVARELERLQSMKQQYAEMPDGSKKEELGAIIKDGEEQYAVSRVEQQRLEDRVLEIEKGLENNQMHITMPDGQEMPISNTSLSQTYDLALLTVAGTNNEGVVLPPSGSALIEGAQVSIIGPRNTSISAAFTGYYRGATTDEFFLQTDRPLNPNNSGGPLIDEDGYVRGINITTAYQLEGAGLAIPIETAVREFNL